MSLSLSSSVMAPLPFRPGRESSLHSPLTLRVSDGSTYRSLPGCGALAGRGSPAVLCPGDSPFGDPFGMALSRTVMRPLAVGVAFLAAVGGAVPAAAQIAGHPIEISGGAGIFNPDARASVKSGPA